MHGLTVVCLVSLMIHTRGLVNPAQHRQYIIIDMHSLIIMVRHNRIMGERKGGHDFTKKLSISKLRDAFCSSRQGLSHDMLRSQF